MDTGQQDNTPVTDQCAAPVTSSDLFTPDNESANAYVPEMEVTSEETQEVVSAEQKSSEVNAPEIQVFRSLEEAYAYIKNYEIATNNKFVLVARSKLSRTDIKSLQNFRIAYNYRFHVGDEKAIIFDGLPTVCIGTEEKECQFGRFRKKNYPSETGQSKKKRNAPFSKKLGCSAMIRIKRVLKFPDYAVDVDKPTSGSIKKMAGRLRYEFSEETKRFMLVYVHIETNHNHEPCPVIRPPKHKALNHKKSEGCNRIVNEYDEHVHKGLVLQKSSSLRGKDLSNLALHFKDVLEIPALTARPRKDQKLEDMDIHELMLLYYEITGQVPNEMFAKACKPFTRQNLILLLHLCIVFANASTDKQTHASVRLKGTESEFTPVECYDEDCALVDGHMHCPFCSKVDSYTNVSLLKAHYTKEHVDKALEFSGMKILRCLDTCQIETKYLNNKTFRYGHWHCFACSNAIEKRPDCFIHYKRHLNEFGSSFQVHIAQDVNSLTSSTSTIYEIQNTLHGIEMRVSAVNNTQDFHGIGIHTPLPGNSLSPSKYVGGHSPSKRPYTDTGLGVHDDVLYVEEDEHGNVLSTYTSEQIPTAGQENVVVSYPEYPDVSLLKTRIREVEMKNKKLERKNCLQNSYIDFLEETISEQKEKHSKEEEKLKAKISELKREACIYDDTSESPITEGNNSNNSHASLGEPAASAIPKKFFTKKNVSESDKKSSVDNPVAMDIVVDQLSELKKEVAGLRNSLHSNITPNINLGANIVGQSTPPVYFIPNQGLTTPYIFPQNMTGLPNTNLVTAQNVPLIHNTAALNTQQQKIVSSVQSDAALPNTDTVNTNTDTVNTNTDTVNTNTDTVNTNTETVNTNTDTLNTMEQPESATSTDDTDISIDESCIQTKTMNCDDVSKLASKGEQSTIKSKVVHDKIFPMKADGTTVDDEEIIREDDVQSEITSPDASPQKINSDATVSESVNSMSGLSNEDSENEDTYYATPLRIEKSTVSKNVETISVPSEKLNTETQSTVEAVLSSNGTSVHNSSTGVVNSNNKTTGTVISGTKNVPSMFPANIGIQSTATNPMMMIPNQNLMNQFITPQNMPTMVNPFGMNASDQFVVVQSQAGSFLVPKSRISGLDKIPGMNSSGNTVPTSKNVKRNTTQIRQSNKSLDDSVTSNNVDKVDKGKSKDNVSAKSTQRIVKAKVTLSDHQFPACTYYGNTKKSNYKYISTPMPKKRANETEPARKEQQGDSIVNTGNTNVTISKEHSNKGLISEQSVSVSDEFSKIGESDDETAVPAKKSKVLVLKVNKEINKQSLNKLLQKTKVLYKNVKVIGTNK